jgi:hypothetical protein
MTDKKHPDLEFNSEAANELDEQAKRADYKVVSARLQEFAEIIAG